MDMDGNIDFTYGWELRLYLWVGTVSCTYRREHRLYLRMHMPYFVL